MYFRNQFVHTRRHSLASSELMSLVSADGNLLQLSHREREKKEIGGVGNRSVWLCMDVMLNEVSL